MKSNTAETIEILFPCLYTPVHMLKCKIYHITHSLDSIQVEILRDCWFGGICNLNWFVESFFDENQIFTMVKLGKKHDTLNGTMWAILPIENYDSIELLF
jgi:hypothetical protein